MNELPIIAWIGYGTDYRPFNIELKRSKVANVNGFLDAQEGLESIFMKDYPLIIVSEDMAAGNIQLPQGLRDDAHGISLHVIKMLRQSEQYKAKPIIVPIYSPVGHTVGEYTQSGATDLVYIGNSGKISEFLTTVRTQLR